MSQQFTLQNVNQILGIKESFKAPDRLMEILFDKTERERVFREFLALSSDLSFDWFHQYFQEEQAERKTNKQDFTPNEVATLITRLAGMDQSTKVPYFETATGTGGIAIARWWNDCLKESAFTYMPHEHYFYLEELSDRAIPFLLFNVAIRGMNAIIWHGDSLERTCRGVFFIQNDVDDFMAFSNINVMPYNDTVKRSAHVSKWVGNHYPAHIESDSERWAANVASHMDFKKKWGDVLARSLS